MVHDIQSPKGLTVMEALMFFLKVAAENTWAGMTQPLRMADHSPVLRLVQHGDTVFVTDELPDEGTERGHRRNVPFCGKCGHPDGHCDYDDQGELMGTAILGPPKVVTCGNIEVELTDMGVRVYADGQELVFEAENIDHVSLIDHRADRSADVH